MPTLKEIADTARPACQRFGVRRLDVFGSLARQEAGAASDIDLLVEFEDPDRQPSKRFFGLLHHLEDNLGCKIDLLTVSGLKNPYFRRQILDEKVTLYDGSHAQAPV